MIRAVLFDLFDTLMYMQPTTAWAEGIRLVEEAGISEERWLAGWRSLAGPAMRGEIKSLPERTRRALCAACGAEPSDDLVCRLSAARERGQIAGARLYDDVLGALSDLRRAGIGLGLVSNIFTYEGGVVDRLGLRELFDAVVLSCEVGICKPDSGIYLAATERLGIAPQECVFVGDGMSRELSGAKAVGMVAVRILRDVRDQDHERDEVYDAQVATLPELMAWLQKLHTDGAEA